MAWGSGQPSLAGLGAATDDAGNFLIPGIILDHNTPYAIRIKAADTYEVRTSSQGLRMRKVRQKGLVPISDEFFDKETRIWVIPEIVLPGVTSQSKQPARGDW